MTIGEADVLVQDYLKILEDKEKRGARRSPSLLPASKEDLLCALKLCIARFRHERQDSDEQLKPLIEAAVFLDSFSNDPVDTTFFVKSMGARRKEIAQFQEEIGRIPRTHEFYWQQIYAVVGIGPEETQSTFFKKIRRRLGIGTKGTDSRESQR